MQVLLLKDVPKIGRRHEVKEVAEGFATNFLIPRGLARRADSGAARTIQKDDQQKQQNRATQKKKEASTLKRLKNKTITITANANAQGHLFAAIHERDIAAAIKQELGIAVSPSAFVLKEAPKALGDFSVSVRTGEEEIPFCLCITTTA